jgi:predicted phosphodiesterase
MSKKSILIIGDAHAHPDHPNDRFDWLGKLILDAKPDIIVDMGDFADMPSLSSFDFGKKVYEGRRYKKDVACAIDARQRVMAPTEVYNKQQAKKHKERYHPRLIALGGNHDDEHITRTIEYDAKLDGLIGVEDLKVAELGWEYHRFGELVDVEGILFTHYFQGGVMGKPLGGLYVTVSMLKKYHTSCVQGHIHYFQERHELRGKGRIHAFVAGCFFDYDPIWTNAHIFYDRGILLLQGVEDGDIESFSWIGLEDIKRRYS